MSSFDALEDEDVYNDIRQWMRFDDEACCAELPNEIEIVFHFRNLKNELKNVPARFQEASPNTTALRIFGNHSQGSQIGIVTRFEEGLEPYLKAWEKKGFAPRLVRQGALEDFCFLMRSKTELVGFHHPSFVRWASNLGDAVLNRFYLLRRDKKNLLLNIKHGNRSFVVEEYKQLS